MSDLIKLVILDLDGTVWDGILLEDGLEDLVLNHPLVEAVKKLDSLGVLFAVASKNHLFDVELALEHFGLSALFIASEVSFEPKSTGIYNILRFVRFAPEACLFVDDTLFEREEVASAFPGIQSVLPEDFIQLSNKNDIWAVASSFEAGCLKKKSYIDEHTRRREESLYQGSFRQFLQQCRLLLEICPPAIESVSRISELTQRTNQINFSTNRYSPDDVYVLLDSSNHMSFIATATDRYGKYGIVGFACLRLEGKNAVIQDLMLSCRIQGKGVESALIAVLAEKAKKIGIKYLIGLYRPTRRNGQISGVFQTLGFCPMGEEGEYQKFRLNLYETLPQRPSHIRIVVSNEARHDEDAAIPFIRNIVNKSVDEGLIHGTILDIGAGWDGVLGGYCDQFLEINGNKHIRLDLESYPRTDIIANAQNMDQLDSESFDSVLCLEVLEHCTNPFALSSELLRVLREGGYAIISAPMNYPIHDTPGDHWRFTPDGLKLLFCEKTMLVSEYVEGHNEHPVRTVLVLQKNSASALLAGQ